MQAGLAMVGVGALATVVVASVAERRRLRRDNLDKVGFMPWPLLTILATLVMLFAFALALVAQ